MNLPPAWDEIAKTFRPQEYIFDASTVGAVPQHEIDNDTTEQVLTENDIEVLWEP